MPDMLHEVTINATPDAVYDALTTPEGLSAWWTDDVAVSGEQADFGFGNRTTMFRMRLETLERPSHVVWHCVGDPDEWRDTRLVWHINGDGPITTVRFAHRNWVSDAGIFAMCNSTWGTLMWRLRDYVEGRNPGPLFASR